MRCSIVFFLMLSSVYLMVQIPESNRLAWLPDVLWADFPVPTLFFEGVNVNAYSSSTEVEKLTTVKQARYTITPPDSLARQLYDRLSDFDHPEGPGFCLDSLESGRISLHSIDDGFKTCREALKIIENLQDQELISQSYNQLYLIYFNLGDFETATRAAERSLAIAEELDYLDMMARGQQNFGILNSVRGRYLAAIEHFLQSEVYYLELNDDLALSQLYLNIGVTFEQAGNVEKAYEYMQKGLVISSLIDNEHYQASAMANIGAIHSREGRADSAFYYYTASLEISELLELDDLIIQNLDNIGAYYSSVEDYDTATSYLMSAYQMAQRTGQSYQEIYITDHLAKNYLAANNPDSARKYAEIQLSLAYEYDFLYDQQLAYLNLSEVYARLNEYEKAFESHQNYAAVKDSLLNRDRIQQLEDLRERYETEQRDQTISMLTLEAETATFRRNTYLFSGILVSLILLLLYGGQRFKSRKNRQLLEKSEEVALMKSNFFSNISHEFRTPLTLISGPIQVLKAGTDDPKMSLQLKVMERNVHRLLSLINQLLDLSRLESGKLTLTLSNRDIVPVIRGVTMTYESLAEMKNIELLLNTEFDRLEVCIDQEKLETILINLITNAFNFTPENGIIEVSLNRALISNQEFCRISVRDSGTGIPEEDLSRIFDRFYQSTNARDGKYEGSGIGLALSKELVELHKGVISVTSREGEGAEFTVMLPLGTGHFSNEELAAVHKGTESTIREPIVDAPVEFDHPEAAASQVYTDEMDETPILLLIEDNEDVMHYLKDILGDTYHILEAADGEAGIATALESIPDLIISDVMMPKKNGYQVCKRLKQDEKTSHVPIILLTAKASHDDKMQGLLTSADEYLTKPFVPRELLVRVQNLIESRRQLRERYNRELSLKPGEISVNSIDEAFLIRVMKVVDDHLSDESFSVEQLGREVGMSRSQIYRKLSALTNRSATEFIRTYRLDRAMDMIKQKAGSISEISFLVGFGSPSYFSKCFRKQFGISPSDVVDDSA